MLQQTFGRTLGYGARVYQAPELDPDSENGPIRRASGRLVRNNPDIDPPRMVYRSPHAVVPDAESAAVYEDPPVWTEKFLPDGRLVPLHDLAGALSDAAPTSAHMTSIMAGVLGAAGVAALAMTLLRK